MKRFHTDPVCKDLLIEIKGSKCELTLVPEMFPQDSGLEFTGSYEGILRSGDETSEFLISPIFSATGGDAAGWEIEPPSFDLSIIEVLDGLIRDFRKRQPKMFSLN